MQIGDFAMRRLTSTIFFIGIGVSLGTVCFLGWQVLVTGDHGSAEALFRDIFASSLAPLLVLTLSWIEALSRLRWIEKDDSWRHWYVNSRRFVRESRSLLLGLIAWTATSLSLLAISDLGAHVVLPSTFVLFGVTSYMLEKAMYRDA